MQPDGRPTGTPHMFHRGNAKHPALSSTSEYSAHLGRRCTVSRKKEARGWCSAVDAGVYEWQCVSIFTQHTFVFFYTEAVHTCVYVYNQMGRSRSSSSAGGGREGQRRRYNQLLRAGLCLERRGGSTSMKEEELFRVSGRQTHRWMQMFWPLHTLCRKRKK